MGCQTRCCMTGIHALLLTFGLLCRRCWAAGLCFPQLTIPRQMVGLKVCIAQSSRPFVACWLKETCRRTCGVSCWVLLSLQSTVLLQRALGRCQQSWPLESYHAHHWMWWCRLVAMWVLGILCSTCRTCLYVLGITWKRRESTRKRTMIATIGIRSTLWGTLYY